MTIQLYNTLGRKKTPFEPLKRGKVSLYSCGPTVYNYAHLGNLRAYIFADILKRTLSYNGLGVKHIMNITDVGHLTSDADTGEDKLEKGATREGKTVWDVAKFYEEAFKSDIEKLNIIPPDKYTRATEYIKEQIELIQKLEKNELTYETEGTVYFDVEKFEEKYPGKYTELSGQKLSDKKIGVRDEVEVDADKRHPADFVLWLKAVGKYADHVMHWPSPWGEGFPGWHIECSAMSIKELGEKIDIHTGGIDHIAVHHANEIAQNIGSVGKPVVKRWMHNEFLVVKDGEKMAKSGENFLTLQSVIDKGFSPLAYRYFCLQTHYRKPLNFSWKAIEAAQNGLEHLRNQANNLGGDKGKLSKEFKSKFLDALNDDLNIPQALAVVQEMFKSELSNKDKRATIEDFDEVLELGLDEVEKLEIPAEVKKLADERAEVRKNKDWTKSDELRDEIEKLGYTIEDAPAGYQIKKK